MTAPHPSRTSKVSRSLSKAKSLLRMIHREMKKRDVLELERDIWDTYRLTEYSVALLRLGREEKSPKKVKVRRNIDVSNVLNNSLSNIDSALVHLDVEDDSAVLEKAVDARNNLQDALIILKRTRRNR